MGASLSELLKPPVERPGLLTENRALAQRLFRRTAHMQQGRPMQHTAPATQHAPAAMTEADVANSATAEKTFRSLAFIYISLKK
jgi:hypothetical protein